MPTLPVDHGWLAAHCTALTTSACSPGPAPVEAAVRAAEAAQVDHHEGVALLQQPRALDEVVEALRRARRRADRVVAACPRPGRPGRSARSG